MGRKRKRKSAPEKRKHHNAEKNTSTKGILLDKLFLLVFQKGYQLQRTFLLLLVPILIFYTYSHTIHSPFIFDDIRNVSENEAIQLTELSFEGLKKAAVESDISTRPVSYITFAVNYYFHEDKEHGYRYVNIVIHMLNGLLLFVFLQNTFNLPAFQDKLRQPFWIAYLAALIWVIHPLQTQSVTYIVQRMNSLATMFYMLAFFCYLKARLASSKEKKWLLFGLTLLSGILALGSKEIAATLPFFILLYEWMFFREMSLQWLKRNRIVIFGSVSVVLILTFFFVGPNPMEYIVAGYSDYDFTLKERLLTQPRVVLHYLNLFFYPHPDRLTLLPHFTISTSLLNPPTTLLAILGIIFLISGTLFIAKKQPLISFCILWFFGNLVIESSFIALDIIFEHRTYLPSMMVSLLVAYLLLQYIRPLLLGRLILFGTLFVLTLWTYQRNVAWADKVYFWRDCLEKNPADVRAYNNLGQALEEKGELHEAINLYREAIEIDPEHPHPYNNLALALANTDKKQEAVDVLHDGLKMAKDTPETLYNLGFVYNSLGELDIAEDYYLEAHEKFDSDDDPDVHNNLGILLGHQGRLDEAIDHFEEAIRINPDDNFAHNNLGITLARKGKFQAAITHFKHALRINPNDKLAWNNLQIVIAEMKPER